MSDDLQLIVSLLTLLAVIIGPAILGVFQSRTAAAERKLAERHAEQHRLEGKIDSLIDLRAKLQFLQAAPVDLTHPRYREMENAYGQAYAVMISVPNKSLRDVAPKVMDGIGYPQDPNEKLAAIDDGIRILGGMLDELADK